MPKGFNQKAMEGFTQWMNAILTDSGLKEKQIKENTEKTRILLSKGFPQIREH